jgi:hypothetical protein
MPVVDGYYLNKEFVESEPLPIVHIGDMVYFKYGRRNEKTRICGVHHYFYENEDTGKVNHWMSVMYKDARGYTHSVQGNWVITDKNNA